MYSAEKGLCQVWTEFGLWLRDMETAQLYVLFMVLSHFMARSCHFEDPAFQLSTCINKSLITSYWYEQKWLASFRKYLWSSKAHVNDRCEHNSDVFWRRDVKASLKKAASKQRKWSIIQQIANRKAVKGRNFPERSENCKLIFSSFFRPLCLFVL